MPDLRVRCSRCAKTIDGRLIAASETTPTLTVGYYLIRDSEGNPTVWAKYAEPGEERVCDDCMWQDPRYLADYPPPQRTIHQAA